MAGAADPTEHGIHHVEAHNEQEVEHGAMHSSLAEEQDDNGDDQHVTPLQPGDPNAPITLSSDQPSSDQTTDKSLQQPQYLPEEHAAVDFGSQILPPSGVVRFSRPNSANEDLDAGFAFMPKKIAGKYERPEKPEPIRSHHRDEVGGQASGSPAAQTTQPPEPLEPPVVEDTQVIEDLQPNEEQYLSTQEDSIADDSEDEGTVVSESAGSSPHSQLRQDSPVITAVHTYKSPSAKNLSRGPSSAPSPHISTRAISRPNGSPARVSKQARPSLPATNAPRQARGRPQNGLLNDFNEFFQILAYKVSEREEAETATANAEKETLQSEIQRLMSQEQALQDELADHRRTYNEQCDQLRKMKLAVEKCKKFVHGLGADYGTLKQQSSEMRHELQAAKQLAEEISAEQDDAKSDFTRYTDKATNIRHRTKEAFNEAQEQLEKLKKQLDDTQRHLEETTTSRDYFHTQLSEKVGLLAEARNRCQSLESAQTKVANGMNETFTDVACSLPEILAKLSEITSTLKTPSDQSTLLSEIHETVRAMDISKVLTVADITPLRDAVEEVLKRSAGGADPSTDNVSNSSISHVQSALEALRTELQNQQTTLLQRTEQDQTNTHLQGELMSCKGRLENLDKQLADARKSELQAQEEIRTLRGAESLRSTCDQLQVQLNNAQAQIEDTSRQLENAKSDLDSKSREIQEISAARSEMQEEMEDLKARLQELQSAVDEAERGRQDAEQRVTESVNAARKEMSESAKQYHAEQKALSDNTIKRLSSEHSNIVKEKDDLEIALEKAEVELEKLRRASPKPDPDSLRKLQEAQAQIETQRQELEQVKAAKERAEGDLREAESLRSEHSALVAKSEGQGSQIAVLTEEKTVLSERVAHCETLENDKKENAKVIDRLHARLSQQEEKTQRLEEGNTVFESRVQNLEAEKDTLQAEIVSLQERVAAEREAKEAADRTKDETLESLQNMQKQLSLEHSKSSELQTANAALESRTRALETQAQQIQKNVEAASDSLSKEKTERDALERDLSELRQQYQIAMAKGNSLGTQFSLDSSQVPPVNPSQAAEKDIDSLPAAAVASQPRPRKKADRINHRIVKAPTQQTIVPQTSSDEMLMDHGEQSRSSSKSVQERHPRENLPSFAAFNSQVLSSERPGPPSPFQSFPDLTFLGDHIGDQFGMVGNQEDSQEVLTAALRNTKVSSLPSQEDFDSAFKRPSHRPNSSSKLKHSNKNVLRGKADDLKRLKTPEMPSQDFLSPVLQKKSKEKLSESSSPSFMDIAVNHRRVQTYNSGGRSAKKAKSSQTYGSTTVDPRLVAQVQAGASKRKAQESVGDEVAPPRKRGTMKTAAPDTLVPSDRPSSSIKDLPKINDSSSSTTRGAGSRMQTMGGGSSRPTRTTRKSSKNESYGARFSQELN